MTNEVILAQAKIMVDDAYRSLENFLDGLEKKKASSYTRASVHSLVKETLKHFDAIHGKLSSGHSSGIIHHSEVKLSLLIDHLEMINQNLKRGGVVSNDWVKAILENTIMRVDAARSSLAGPKPSEELYPIEDGVPLPSTKRPPSNRYPFWRMKVGQSFRAADEQKKIASAARSFGEKNNMKFSVFIEGTGCRCWRVE